MGFNDCESMDKTCFAHCLEIGQKFEKLAISINLKDTGIDVEERCNDYRYDFLTKDGVKHEVKADLRGNETGNIYIEFEHKGRKSGITKTESKYWWIFLTEKTYYKFKTIDILKAIKDKKYFKIAECFDGNSKGYLFKKDVLAASCCK